MKYTETFLKYCRVLLATSVFALMALASCRLLAQEEQSLLILGDKRYNVTIRHSEVGLLLTGKALENRDGTIAALDSLGIKVSGTINRGPVIGTIEATPERLGLVQRLRQLNSMQSDLIEVAGLVVHYPGTEATDVVTDQFLVKFKETTSREDIRKLHQEFGAEVIFTSPYAPKLQLVRAVRASDDALTLSNKYNEAGIVEYAQPNFLKQPAPRQATLSDPLLSKQWHLINTAQNGGAPDADIDADKAWTIQRGSPDILIAILDGGFEWDHPDLKDNLWVNGDDVAGDHSDNDKNGYIDDVNGWDFSCAYPKVGCGDNDTEWTPDLSLPPGEGWTPEHGTLSAGAAAARGDNKLGVSGSCPNCKFVPIRLGRYSVTYYLAIQYANLIGADIISNSWGCDSGSCEPVVEDAIDDVARNGRAGKGTPIFFAMPNEHVDHCAPPGTEDYSSRDTVIAISMVDNLDKILTGLGTVASPAGGFGDCMDVLSPSWGGTLWATTTDLTGRAGYNNSNLKSQCAEGTDRDYTFCASGTSFAAPVAAGVGGLILSADPSLSRVQVQQLLQDTADKVQPSTASYSAVDGKSHPPGKGSTHSYGRINAYEAVRIAAAAAKGRGGVDVFVRDNELDWGNTEQLSSLVFDFPRGFIPHWISADIKVDAPPYMTPPTNSAKFEAMIDENPISGAVNRVYVRVRNRGPKTADNVTVKLHWAYSGMGLPALPSDFWTTFPNNSSDTSKWKPMLVQTIVGLKYSGASVAGKPAADGEPGDEAQILRFDFAAPPFDSGLPNPTYYCLFAVVDSPQDQVSPEAKASLIVDDISPRDNNITQRNIIVLPAGSPSRFDVQLNVGNPFDRAIKIQLHLQAPEGWAVESSEIPFDQDRILEPGTNTLTKIALKTATLPIGQSASIYQITSDDSSRENEILSGITIRPAQQ